MFGLKKLWHRLRPEASSNKFSADYLKQQIPYYLAEDKKKGLIKALREFPDNIGYYQNMSDEGILQGDGWTKLQIINFASGERAAIQGIILSNTCDIAPENPRDLPVKIVFAPMIPLAAYGLKLTSAKIAKNAIEDKLSSIRKQKITSIFYLPAGAGLREEHIVIFDDIHSMPAQNFYSQSARERVFTLSQIGFYLFVFKLSVHFCRFHENVVRQ